MLLILINSLFLMTMLVFLMTIAIIDSKTRSVSRQRVLSKLGGSLD